MLCVFLLAVPSVAVVHAKAVAGTLPFTHRLKDRRRATGDLLKYLLAGAGLRDSAPYWMAFLLPIMFLLVMESVESSTWPHVLGSLILSQMVKPGFSVLSEIWFSSHVILLGNDKNCFEVVSYCNWWEAWVNTLFALFLLLYVKRVAHCIQRYSNYPRNFK